MLLCQCLGFAHLEKPFTKPKPLDANNLAGQISELLCQVIFAVRLILLSALGVIRLGPEEIASAAGCGSKSPRSKGRAVANSER